MMTRRMMAMFLALGCLTPALAQEQSRERWRGHWPKPELREAEIDMAATTHRWRNTGGDNLWATVANWDSGALPGSGGAGLDTVIFDGVSQADCYGDDRSLDNQLLRLITMPEYEGNIGSNGNPLIHYVDSVGAANGRVIHRGSGRFYFQAKNAGVNHIVVDTPLTRVASMILSGRADVVCVKSGWVSITSTCSVISYLVANGKAAYVVMEAVDGAETKPPVIVATNGARIDNYRATNTAAGSLLATGPSGVIYQIGLIDDATLILQNGGHIIPQPTSQPAAPWPDLICDGHFDASQTPYQLGIAQMIVGQLANVSGNVGTPDAMQKAGHIDLREDYP